MDQHYNFSKIEKSGKTTGKKIILLKLRKIKIKRNIIFSKCFLSFRKLHMGHVRNYSIGDVISRYMTMRGERVAPNGLGFICLPAENAAIKNHVHPNIWTWKNIEEMRQQLKMLGLSYDWDREIATCHPDYYKWMQWIFIQFFNKGLAYKRIQSIGVLPVRLYLPMSRW